MSEVVLEHVSKVYPNGFEAIRDLNLEIADGEFLVLVGPSGCGKSTALRMIAGLEEISEGTLRIGDRVVNDLEPKDRDIAMVFQNYALYPHMTVRDNIGFALKLARLPKDEIDERVDKAAAILELGPQLDKKPGQLSGGQRQRVAMGRAIVRQPAAFLMDEPLSNLDAKLRVQMRAEIASLQRSLGVTTFYVTHDQVEAMTMGDRVAVIRAGILQQVDGPQELYDRPDNIFVAGFIGSPAMNLFEGTFEATDGGGVVHLGEQSLGVGPELLAARPALRSYEGKPIGVGIRPESTESATLAPDAPADRRLRTRADLVEALGSELIVHYELKAKPLVTEDTKELAADRGDVLVVQELEHEAARQITKVVGKFSPKSHVREGDDLEVVVETDELHFFDLDTTKAIWS